jgi:hypothetical protein
MYQLITFLMKFCFNRHALILLLGRFDLIYFVRYKDENHLFLKLLASSFLWYKWMRMKRECFQEDILDLTFYQIRVSK